MTAQVPPETPPAQGADLTAADVAAWLAASIAALRERAAAINAVNVFPVADADTADNLVATLESTLAASAERGGAYDLDSLARGALLGARGNSGLILAAWLGGFTRGGAVPLAAALEAAATHCHAVVAAPAPGTLLTVARAAADAAGGAGAAGAAGGAGAADAAGGAGAAEAASRAASLAAWEATVATAHDPNHDPVHPVRHGSDRGVPDAGAWGLAVLLDRLAAQIAGEDTTAAARRAAEVMLHAAAARRLAHSADGPRMRGGAQGTGHAASETATDPHAVRAAEPDTEIVAAWADAADAADTADAADRLRAVARAALGSLGGDSLVVTDLGSALALHVHVHRADLAAWVREISAPAAPTRLTCRDILTDADLPAPGPTAPAP